MIDLVIQQIITADLSSSPITDIFTRIGGIVRTQKEQVNGTVKSYPVVRDAASVVCEGGDYLDFVPNSTEIGMLYFEELSSQKKTIRTGIHQSVHNVRLIGWLKLTRVDPQSVEQVAANIAKAITFKQTDLTYIKDITVDLSKPMERSPDVFSKYTYSEEQKQFLMHPFNWFSLDFVIRYTFNENCVPTISLVADAC